MIEIYLLEPRSWKRRLGGAQCGWNSYFCEISTVLIRPRRERRFDAPFVYERLDTLKRRLGSFDFRYHSLIAWLQSPDLGRVASRFSPSLPLNYSLSSTHLCAHVEFSAFPSLLCKRVLFVLLFDTASSTVSVIGLLLGEFFHYPHAWS